MARFYRPSSNPDSKREVEFDYEAEWTKFCNDALTAKRFINFGKDGKIIPCNNTVNLGLIDAPTTATPVEALPLVCGSTSFSSNVFTYKNANIHRSGAAHAAPFIGAVPTGTVSPALIKALHSGAINVITVYMAAFLGNGSNTESLAQVVQTQEFYNCIFTFVDMMTFPFLTIFEYSYTKHKVIQQDYSQSNSSEGYGNQIAKKVSYEFDYTVGTGTSGS